MQPAPPTDDQHENPEDPEKPEDPDGQSFTNEPIDVAGLPRLPDGGFEALDPRYLRIRWIVDAVVAAVVVIVATAATAALPDTSPMPRWVPGLVALGVLALIALNAWLQWLEVGRLGYLVREQDVSFRSGVISRSVITVPYARIQHVSIGRGPLARAFGLATVQMRTAGSGGITVPGMDVEAAQGLKALIVERAGSIAEDELAR